MYIIEPTKGVKIVVWYWLAENLWMVSIKTPSLGYEVDRKFHTERAARHWVIKWHKDRRLPEPVFKEG